MPIVVDDSAVATDETIAVETEQRHYLVVMLGALGGRGFLHENGPSSALFEILKRVDTLWVAKAFIFW